jgi:hypothetical protein
MSSLGQHVRKLDRYASALGPHARLLFDEMRSAATIHPAAPATVIILAAAVIDVMLREPTGRPAAADGIDIAEARDRSESFWLRERRNGIVHYEGGRGGLMGEDEDVLEKDAMRAIDALAAALDILI